MRICPVSVSRPRVCARQNVTRMNGDCPRNNTPSESLSFRGDKSAALGIVTGAAIGAGITALTVMTGGLAAVVAAVGTTGTIAAGAGAGTHLGGIIGGLLGDD